MRAQASMEFLAFLGILATLLLFFSIVSFNREGEVLFQNNLISGWAVCQTGSSEINAAVSTGGGYSHYFVLPQFIGVTTDYTISYSPAEKSVVVNWTDGGCRLPILTSNISGSFAYGRNLVRNSGGWIYLNE